MTKVMTFRQLSLFDAPDALGEYVNAHGAALTFRELQPGMRVVLDKSTKSHPWFRLMEVRYITRTPDGLRALLSAGYKEKDKAYIDEFYVRLGAIHVWREA